jgi:hypothetical protein
MSDHNRALRQLVRWITDKFVQDVSADDAICAFDCRRGQCTIGEWATCGRRLNRAAGELMPASEQESSAQVKPAPPGSPSR